MSDEAAGPALPRHEWTNGDAALLARGIVRAPGGDIRIPVALTPGKWVAGSRCTACGALKVHPRRVDGAPFCFACGVLQ